MRCYLIKKRIGSLQEEYFRIIMKGYEALEEGLNRNYIQLNVPVKQKLTRVFHRKFIAFMSLKKKKKRPHPLIFVKDALFCF